MNAGGGESPPAALRCMHEAQSAMPGCVSLQQLAFMCYNLLPTSSAGGSVVATQLGKTMNTGGWW